jgi:F-type H+-transporting ATPase subunit gamma
MAIAKEIRARINSISSTKKITNAMQLIAASKLRKARNRVEASKPYAKRITEVIEHLTLAHPEYHHIYLTTREVKRIGIIVIATDRGLCGGLNNHLFKQVVQHLSLWNKENIEVDAAIIGHKAEIFFKNLPVNLIAYAHHLGDAPKIKDIFGSIQIVLQAFKNGTVDEVYLFHNEFVNTIKQKPQKHKLLPVSLEENKEQGHWDYIYEPDAKSLLTLLLERYVESQVYQAVIENVACEQAARMMAMKNATDNASEIIHSLKLKYNKARQAAITKELSEIVSGAEAV